MDKKLVVLYNSNYNKSEIYNKVKYEVKKLYKLLYNANNDKNNKKILEIYEILDKKKDNYFRILFFLSLYCSYFHKIKHKINIHKLTKLNNECYKKNNFVLLDIDNMHKEILQDISTVFNTDAVNILPITGKILYDLYNIDVELKKMP